MDTPLKNIDCPSCGGLLRQSEGMTVASCSYCGVRYFVGDMPEPRYVLPVCMDRRQAAEVLLDGIRAVEKAEMFEGGMVAADFRKSVHLVSETLYFVPFFRYTALRIGTAPQQREDEVVVHREFVGEEKQQMELHSQVELRYKLETKTVLSESCMVVPGLDLGAEASRLWGLSRLLGERDFTGGGHSDFEPWDRRQMESKGTVLSPLRTGAEVLAFCRSQMGGKRSRRRSDLSLEPGYTKPERVGEVPPGTALNPLGIEKTVSMDFESLDFHVDVLDDRVSLHFCPLWRMKMEYRGRMLSAAVDAHRGTLLSLEVPLVPVPPRITPILRCAFYSTVAGLAVSATPKWCPFPVQAVHALGTVLVAVAGWHAWRDLSRRESGPIPLTMVVEP